MNIEKSNNIKPIKTDRWALITTIVIICVFIASIFYYYHHSILNKGTFTELNDGNIVYQVETAEITDNILHLSGWCCYLDAKLSSEDRISNMRVILIPTDNYEEFHYFNVDYGIARPEIEEYYQTENDITHCGFDATLDLSDLDLAEHNYEVTLQPDERREGIVRPRLYLYRGIISPAENEFIKPNVIGTDLEEVVNNGILRVYEPNYGMYIYQYNWKLYFIGAENYPFDEGLVKYAFNVYTNHPELLSNDRQAYSFEALGWGLLSYEITDSIDSGIYRVSVREIPTTYPVKHIDTGNWTKEDGWTELYRICPGIFE